MAKCPFCGQEINNPATYNENRKKMIENGMLALKRIDKIKEQNKMLIENARNNGNIYVRKKLDTKQRGKEKETVYSTLQIGKKFNIFPGDIPYTPHDLRKIFDKDNKKQVDLNSSIFTFNPNKRQSSSLLPTF